MTDFHLGSMTAEISGEGPAVVMVHGRREIDPSVFFARGANTSSGERSKPP